MRQGEIMKKYTYPIITEENFEEMTNRYIVKVGYDRFRMRVKQPRTRDEFYEMTKSMFGTGLSFNGSAWSPSYEIEQKEDVYSETPLGKLYDEKYSQYDGLRPFLQWTFAEIHYGGVAGSHYGQYRVKGYRHKKRLESLYSSTLSVDKTSSNQT